MAEAEKFADKVSYPVLVRPSYVLSGAAMSVIHSQDELKERLESAAAVSPDHPVVITKYFDNAEEIDVDAVASAGQLLIHAVSSHVEKAGVHSGDATLVLPPVNLDEATMARLKGIAERLAHGFRITGPFNMQIIKVGDELKVIECNIRASRSFPFSSKVLGTNFVEIATRAIVAENIPEPKDLMAEKRDYVATKAAQFSWTRLAGADPFLGVEMASTGEIACFGKDLVEAYWATIQSLNNFHVPPPGSGLLLGGNPSKPELVGIVDYLKPLGYKFFAENLQVKEKLEASAKDGCTVELIEFPTTDKRALRQVFQKYNIKGILHHLFFPSSLPLHSLFPPVS